MVKPPVNNLATRASLLARLKDWDNADGWKEFLDTYQQLIYRVALKSGLTEEESQDAVQETLLAVAKNIGDFEYDRSRCSFKSWLMLITRQRIIWQLRKRLPSHQGSREASTRTSRTATIDRIPAPDELNLDSVWEEEWQKKLFDAALQRVKYKISPRHFQIFDLYVLRNWKADEVARTLRISTARVYLTKHRVTTLLSKEVKSLERDLGAVSPSS
jgi:RNA polymerase sigma factor (sigma-70 family)